MDEFHTTATKIVIIIKIFHITLTNLRPFVDPPLPDTPQGIQLQELKHLTSAIRYLFLYLFYSVHFPWQYYCPMLFLFILIPLFK